MCPGGFLVALGFSLKCVHWGRLKESQEDVLGIQEFEDIFQSPNCLIIINI